MEKAAQKKRKLKGDERRQQIIQTAMKLFSRHGFRGTTMRQVAARAGISEAMIYHHFPSKGALYDAMLQEKIDDSRHLFYPLEAVGSKQDRVVIETIVGNFLRQQARDNSFMRMLLFSALEGHELAGKVVQGPMQDFFRFLGSYLEERMEDGALKVMNGQIAARLLLGMAFYSALLREIYLDPGIQSMPIEELERTIVNLFCEGAEKPAQQMVKGV